MILIFISLTHGNEKGICTQVKRERKVDRKQGKERGGRGKKLVGSRIGNST